MIFDKVCICAVVVLIIFLSCLILFTVIRSFKLSAFGKKHINNLEMNIVFEQEKLGELSENEILLKNLNESLNWRIFEIFKKTISLQKIIFEIYNRP